MAQSWFVAGASRPSARRHPTRLRSRSVSSACPAPPIPEAQTRVCRRFERGSHEGVESSSGECGVLREEWGVGTSTGFSIIELLIAMTITILIAGAIAGVAPQARAAFERVPADLDLQQRGRTAIDVLSQALRSAGNNVAATESLGALSDLLPTVSVSGEDEPGVFTELTVIIPVPDAAQATLDADQASARWSDDARRPRLVRTSRTSAGSRLAARPSLRTERDTSTSSRSRHADAGARQLTPAHALSQFLSGGIGARRSGSIRLQPSGAARWQLFARPQDGRRRGPANCRFREWPRFRGDRPERRRRVLSDRAGGCLAQCRGAERCSCAASFPIASFGRRSDCEMCHEKRTWNRVDHGDPVHGVPVGAGSWAPARRVHGSIGDRQHERIRRDVVRGRCGYRARGARSCRNAGLGCRALRFDAEAASPMERPAALADYREAAASISPPRRTCSTVGKSSNCTAAQMNANSRERPWGINNPRWQLYAYGPIEQLAPLLRPAPGYLGRVDCRRWAGAGWRSGIRCRQTRNRVTEL